MNMTTEKLKRIKIDSAYGKKKHFNAADRNERYHFRLGVPLVILNVLTSSILLYFITEGATNWIKYIPLVLALFATIFGGLQTFLNFQRKAEGHRRIGNRYLSVMKKCDRLQAYIIDNTISAESIPELLEEIATMIDSINQDAEAFPVSSKDYEKARKGIQSGEEDYIKKELEL